MICTVLVFASCLTTLTSALGMHFMDCPGNDNVLGLLRKCCTSDQLPKGCECFDISSSTDFTNTLFHKAQCPAEINVAFNLFTRAHRNSATRIRSGDANIRSSPYNGAKKTVFVAHGFTDFGSAPWCLGMKNALLDAEDLNVILVDWQAGAKGPNYYQAVANTRVVGAMIGRLIQDFHTVANANFGNFHLIGHSLGAQIMGYAGKEIFRLTNQKVGRISGLDPAGPGFENYSDFVRIDKSDGQFVDIMHTDAELLLNSGFGTRFSIGHVDFYPNGGVHQPGCPPETYGILSMISFESEKNTGACSHGRAVDYFTYSINRCRYNPPNGDASCTMGYHVSRSCKGDYHPHTTSTVPFC
ncbi:unnamed protein product [Lymnaea stagnalis]|uniref:Lipase domain-containing protein n=1 Tax=Lymnaea stagnalis TaxID=6523 RepID=A0AAV2H3J5_LYMST